MSREIINKNISVSDTHLEQQIFRGSNFSRRLENLLRYQFHLSCA